MEVLEPIWEVHPIGDPTSWLRNEAFNYTLKESSSDGAFCTGLDKEPEDRERRRISKDTELLFAHLLINMCRFGEFCLRLACTLRYHLVSNIAENRQRLPTYTKKNLIFA